MRIGLKFCGGCNPRHDRGEFANRIRLAFDTVHEIENAVEGEMYDYLLLIGGCTNCCANYAVYRIKERVLSITHERDFENVVYYLDH